MRGHIRLLIVPLILCLTTLAACGAVISPASMPSASTPATRTPTAATQATLACAGRMLPIGAAEENGMALRCTVTGAPASATSFQLSATLPGGADIAARTYPLCAGTLQTGKGACSRNLIAPSNEWGASLTVGGVLLPGGIPLPAATISTR